MTNRGLIIVVLLLGGCATSMPKSALRLSESTLDLRSMQTRVFEAESEQVILNAAVATMQDMEYNIDEIEQGLGIITASKTTDADATAAIAKFTILELICIAASACHVDPTDIPDKHTVTMSMVVLPSLARANDFTARVTVHYETFNTKGETIKLESIVDDDVYQEIFRKLSNALFIQANIP
jgi:hypothetical protein